MPFHKMLRTFDVQESDQDDTDQIGLCWTPQLGNCSGVTNWIELGEAEIELVKRLNPPSGGFSTEEKIQWAVWERAGGIYFAEDRKKAPWRWPSIVMGSKSAKDGEYNTVNVYFGQKGYLKIETIPVMASYEHITLESHPHLVHRVFVTNARGITYDTPKGMFFMPLFSPEGRRHAKGNVSGMWLRERYAGEAVLAPVPPLGGATVNALKVVTLRRTVLRQGPRASSPKIDPVAMAGERMSVMEQVNGWGNTGRRGWVWMGDVAVPPSLTSPKSPAGYLEEE